LTACSCYGGKNINTLRLWAANAPDYFEFQAFSHGDFVGAVAETLTAETSLEYSTGRLHEPRTGLRFVQEYFLVACSLPISYGASDAATQIGTHFLKVAIQLNDTHPTLASPS